MWRWMVEVVVEVEVEVVVVVEREVAANRTTRAAVPLSCSRPLFVRTDVKSFSFGPTNNALIIRLAGYIPGSDIGLRNAKKNQPQAPRNPECFPLRPCL
jgi:hypothetical protein